MKRRIEKEKRRRGGKQNKTKKENKTASFSSIGCLIDGSLSCKERNASLFVSQKVRGAETGGKKGSRSRDQFFGRFA